MKQPGDQWVVEVDANIDGLERSLDEAARVGERFAGKLVSAFDAVVVRGRSVESVVKDLALGLSKLALGEALKPMQGAFGSLFGQLFSGLAFGKGGVFQSGSPTAFAKGGVISSPTLFPLAGGRTGLAGERGAEAIMPLARGRRRIARRACRRQSQRDRQRSHRDARCRRLPPIAVAARRQPRPRDRTCSAEPLIDVLS